MSIIDTFDNESREIIGVRDIVHKIKDFPETVVVTFSQKFHDILVSMYPTEELSEMYAGRRIPVSSFMYGKKRLGFYHTILGGSASSALLEEVLAMGAKNVLFFGSCGSLNKEITAGHLIVPTHAYRDEGTSYHYMPTSDYIEVKTADRLASVFDALGVSYIKTRTWTTDSFYRETEANAFLRKKEGCDVVEMECASIMSVGSFRGACVYEFFYAADCLDDSNWDRRILGNMPDDMRARILKVALETAVLL